MPCASSQNQLAIDESNFWDENGIHWEPHRIGWTIAGGCTVLTLVISTITVLQHCRNYTNPRQQRQILRILYMPPVYAIISFLSYRFFRYYTYYAFIYIAYEAITLSAFLLLIIEYVAATATGNSADRAIERKDKRPLPIPFCCWRYRPTKAYFMHSVKWSVLQYIIIRPAASIAGIISVYIECINFVSISIALYGLLVFYGLMAEELKGKRPVAKFLAIKLIVMFTFYQTFMFNALQGRVIKETQYWTTTNIANGLNALAICIEMVFFAVLMWWAYTAKEYTRPKDTKATAIWRPLWDSLDYMDFAKETWYSTRFFFNRKPHPDSRRLPDNTEPKSSGTPYQRTPAMHYPNQHRMSFAEAFGIADHEPHNSRQHSARHDAYPMQTTNHKPASTSTPDGYDDERERLRPSLSPVPESPVPAAQSYHHAYEEADLGYHDRSMGDAARGMTTTSLATQMPRYPPPQHYHSPQDQNLDRHQGAYQDDAKVQHPPHQQVNLSARDSYQSWPGARAM